MQFCSLWSCAAEPLESLHARRTCGTLSVQRVVPGRPQQGEDPGPRQTQNGKSEEEMDKIEGMNGIRHKLQVRELSYEIRIDN